MSFGAGVPASRGSGGDLTPRVASPRIGSNDGLDPLDLDEVEYTAPADAQGKFWVAQSCAWARTPRVRQFLRPKFCAIPLSITITACFLSLAITLITTPQFADRDETIIIMGPAPASNCTQQLWTAGALLIRDPTNLAQLRVMDPSNAATVSALSRFDITPWDSIAQFNGTHIELFGPQRRIDVEDTHAGALGANDAPEPFNSWGALPGEWSATTDQWYARHNLIRIFSWVSQTSASVNGSAGTPLPAVLASADAPLEWYLFNNRTDVHVGAYAAAGTFPAVIAGNSSSTEYPSHPHYHPPALYRLQLFVSGTQLRMCADRFASPTLPTSSTGAAVVSDTTGATGMDASSSTGV